jgi:ubiquinone/menaquinone biosynthesis C-methylase UbiE
MNERPDATPRAAGAGQLRADGERFLPGQMSGVIELEHLHRYRMAARWTRGLEVLDIACGEGYGSEMLARAAKRVVGVDIDAGAVRHAASKYRAANLLFLVGSCSSMPLPPGSVDAVVSFETIEHHAEHDLMMQEIRRVLRAGGLLVMSSPDRLAYSDKRNFANPFHVRELYREQFQSLLLRHFRHVALLGQRVLMGSLIDGHGMARAMTFQSVDDESRQDEALPDALYWIGLASDAPLPELQSDLLECALDARAEQLLRRADTQTTGLLKAIAVPGSAVLARHLKGAWYLHENGDLVTAGVDPVRHWQEFGASEGRMPSLDPAMLVRELLTERDARVRGAEVGKPNPVGE